MSYLLAIKTAIVVFPIISIFFTVPFILYEYHKYGSVNKFRSLIIYSFVLYLIIIYFLVILPLPKKEDVVFKNGMIKLIPFGFIFDFLKETSLDLTRPKTYINALKEPCFYSTFFNILMTIPFGMYLRYYFKLNLKKVIIFSFLLSLFFEFTQITGLYYIYKYQYRVFDVDDLITNTFGGFLGFYLCEFIIKYLPSRDKIDETSYKNGEKVSCFRRIMLFFLDLLSYIFITISICLIFKNNNLKYITFIIYYIFIPYFFNSQTLGGKYLNVKINYNNYKMLKIILRNFFLILYFFLPYFLIIIISHLNNSIVKVFVIFIIFILYLYNILKFLHSSNNFYDKLLNIKFESTIKNTKRATCKKCNFMLL